MEMVQQTGERICKIWLPLLSLYKASSSNWDGKRETWKSSWTNAMPFTPCVLSQSIMLKVCNPEFHFIHKKVGISKVTIAIG